MPATIAALSRHPVKGLSPEPLDAVTLTAGAHFPADRIFAIENGPSGFDPAAPEHLPKFKFLMLMRNARLAGYQTRYDDAAGVLSIKRGGETLAEGDLGTAAGRAAIERFCAAEFADELRGTPRVLVAPPGFRFMDSRSGFVSLLNLASLRVIAAKAGRAGVDPRRFRANIMVDGLPPWGEFDLIDREIGVGGARLRVTKRIVRCAATHVDPTNGVRDLDMVGLLAREFDHNDCGIYAEVIRGGEIKVGDAVTT